MKILIKQTKHWTHYKAAQPAPNNISGLQATHLVEQWDTSCESGLVYKNYAKATDIVSA